MEVKDEIISWFLRNILIPRMEIIDKPAFIICKVSGQRGKTNLRELFVPERLYSMLETEIVNSDKKQGRSTLYTAGKKFGFIYSGLSNFPNVKRYTMKDTVNFIYYFTRYMEATYARKITYKIDSKKLIYKMFMDNYVICRFSGIGHLLSDGGSAGVWSYMMCDPNIEAIKPKCQGRGDKNCEVIAAPYEILDRMGYKPLRCTGLETLKLDNKYLEINKIRPSAYAVNSLKKLIDTGFFKYDHGQITYKDERFFLCEASFMYIVEKELKKTKNGLDILWSCSFDFGKRLAEIAGGQDPAKFIMDFFPALGFGDILVKRAPWKVLVNFFPWTKWADDVDFVMFRGILSGFISGLTSKNIELKKIKKYVSENGFSLMIEE